MNLLYLISAGCFLIFLLVVGYLVHLSIHISRLEHLLYPARYIERLERQRRRTMEKLIEQDGYDWE